MAIDSKEDAKRSARSAALRALDDAENHVREARSKYWLDKNPHSHICIEEILDGMDALHKSQRALIDHITGVGA